MHVVVEGKLLEFSPPTSYEDASVDIDHLFAQLSTRMIRDA